MRSGSAAVRGGITRAAVILLVLIAVMVVVIAIPGWRAYKEQADRIGCMASLKTARDSLAIEVITEGDALTERTSKLTLARTMPGRDKLCPAGGDVYFIPQENGTYDVVCALHDADLKLRTRLSATHAADLAENEFKRRLALGEDPDAISITVNGSALECVRVTEPVPIHRGTSTTAGYDGVVAFFAVEGDEGWSDTGVREGEICYFLYADEEHYAVWTPAKGWDGDCLLR